MAEADRMDVVGDPDANSVSVGVRAQGGR